MINYDIAIESYPEKVEEFLTILRNINSKYKETDVEKIKWGYNFKYFVNKGEYTEEYREKLWSMLFPDRIIEELRKVRLSIVMTAGNFTIVDRVDGIPEQLKAIVEFMTIQKMITEQSHIGNEEVIASIPIPEQEVKPLTLSEQLTQALDNEDYERAAEIKREMDAIDEMLCNIQDN